MKFSTNPNDPVDEVAKWWIEYHKNVEITPSGVQSKPDGEPYFQFELQLDNWVRNVPETAWQVIQVIFITTKDDFIQACLAAGPLEDLLSLHGEKFIDRIEKAAANNSAFKELLVAVWRNEIPLPVWNRIQRAIS
jgi:hypothetical protein